LDIGLNIETKTLFELSGSKITQQTAKAASVSKRQKLTIIWSMHNTAGGWKIHVCKTFLFNTLGISLNDKKTVHTKSNQIGVCHEDEWSKYLKRLNTISEARVQMIKDHINLLWGVTLQKFKNVVSTCWSKLTKNVYTICTIGEHKDAKGKKIKTIQIML
jgi:hypothetical protein